MDGTLGAAELAVERAADTPPASPLVIVEIVAATRFLVRAASKLTERVATLEAEIERMKGDGR